MIYKNSYYHNVIKNTDRSYYVNNLKNEILYLCVNEWIIIRLKKLEINFCTSFLI
jgi:hypothetical protein